MDRHQASYVRTIRVTLDLIGSCWALLDGDAGWKGIKTGMICMDIHRTIIYACISRDKKQEARLLTPRVICWALSGGEVW